MADRSANPTALERPVGAHRLAWALLAVGLVMVGIGALATSYSAEMAVPDWPTTFGHNPLLYPVSDWPAVGDVALVQSYRLLGFATGCVALVLCVTLWRGSLRWLGVAALLAYAVQETLGGLRVVYDEVLLANLRDCTAAVFLAVVTAIVVVTSARWYRAESAGRTDGDQSPRSWTIGAVVAIFVQIVLGAQLRHLPVNAPTVWFGLLVWLHLIAAAVVLTVAIALVVQTRRRHGTPAMVRRRAWWLLGLIVGQIVLGASGWVTRFGWPVWFADLFGRPEYTVVAEGRLQVAVVTSHVVVGVVSLLVAVSLALWTRRLTKTA